MDLKHTVSKRVKALRQELGISQKQLAEKTGLNVRYISRVETNPQNLTLDILDKVASGLGCTAADLVSPNVIPPTSKKNLDAFDRAVQLLNSFRTEMNTED